MASINFNCPNCGQELSADKKLSESITLCPTCETAIRVPQFNVYSGLVLGDFIIKRKLGVGGMGEVWLAEQKSMQREVALKILSPALAEDENFCIRFQQEAKNSGKLMHPNIVTAFYAGVEDNLHYLAMSYVEGRPLEEVIEEYKTIPEQQALAIIRNIAEALDYGWSKFKLIHRDIKPSNIMLTRDGSAKLLDLGISKSIIEGDSSMTLTKAGVFVGTPYYVSPEQVRNVPDLDCRADIYSLGAVLFHMLCGIVPYEASTPMGVVAMHLSEPLPDIRRTNPETSTGLSALVRKMMDKDRSKRYASWTEVIDDVDKLAQGTSTSGILSAQLKLLSQNRFVMPIILSIAVLVLLISIFLLIPSASSKNKNAGTNNANNNAAEEDPFALPITPVESDTKAPVATKSAKKDGKGSLSKTAKRQNRQALRPPEALNFDFSFFRGHLQLTTKQEEEIRNVFGSTKRRVMDLHQKFRQEQISEPEFRDRIARTGRRLQFELKHILSTEQLRKYREWDKKEANGRWRGPQFPPEEEPIND